MRVSGTLAELECEVDDGGHATYAVVYWRGGEYGDDEKVRREFGTVKDACRFLATVAGNKARAWVRL